MSISNGVISATDTTYSNATTSQAGLMSATDKTKLDSTDSNYAHTLTMSYTASTNGLNIGIADLNGNVLDEGIVEITNIPEKMSDLTNDSGYVKNTDYATGTGGVVKSGAECFKVDTIGRPYCDDLNYATYQNISDTSFMSKGTLESVLAERQKKIDYYESLVDQIIPTTTGEGTDISLNTIQADMSIARKGNTTQDTINGYQLFQGISYSVSTSGIDFTYNLNGGIYAKGTASADAFSMTTSNSSPYRFNLSSGNYIVSGGSENIRVQVINSSGTTLANDTGSNATFTLSETTSVYVRIQVKSGTNISNGVTTYPMLESGTTAHTWEQYCGGIPSPNPDYPQDINVVSGDNTIVVENKNLARTPTYIGYNINSDGLGTSNNYAVSQKMYVGSNTKFYYGLLESLSSAITDQALRIGFFKSDDTFISRSYVNNLGTTINEVNIPTNTSYIMVGAANVNGTTNSLWNEISKVYWGFSNTMVEHQEQTQLISLSSKNLYDPSTIATGERSGITISYSNGNIVLNGTSTATIDLYLYNGTGSLYTYVNSHYGNDVVSNDLGYDNYIHVTSGYKTNTANITAEDQTDKAFVRIPSGVTLNNKIIKIQLEVGTIATSYAPYFTPIELCKIGNYKDGIFHAVNGDKYYDSLTSEQKALLTYNSWYKHQVIRHYDFAIADMNNSEDYPGWRNNDQATQIKNDFEVTSGNNPISSTIAKCNIRSTGNLCVINSSGQLFLSKSYYGSDYTQTYWKTNYPNLVFTLYYGLPSGKETDIEITDTTLLSQLNNIDFNSYNPITNISTDKGLMIIYAEALGNIN